MQPMVKFGRLGIIWTHDMSWYLDLFYFYVSYVILAKVRVDPLVRHTATGEFCRCF